MGYKRTLWAVLTILSVLLVGCKVQKEGKTEKYKVVKLGVVGTVYDDLWAPAKEQLQAEGIDLQLIQFSDYATPNNALNSGEIDLNAFQHEIYLNSEIENYGYDIQNIGYSFVIPLNLYSSKVESIEQIGDGDTIAIPNDVTNGGRALRILEAAGFIKLKSNAPYSPTKADIETYTIKIEIKELAANTIPSALPDVTAAVINGNFALDYGLKTDEAIFKDTSLENACYWNLIAARTLDLKDTTKVETYKKVIEAFQTDTTKKIFNENYGGYFISVGWEQDLLAQ